MNEMETVLNDEVISDYLYLKYPDESLQGHRQQLYAAAFDITKKILDDDEIGMRDTIIMRWAWECSRTGHQNIACAALANGWNDSEYPYFENINFLLHRNGFLSKREQWHTKRIKKVKAYRGCSVAELENNEFGYSWTLDKEVAHFFAEAHSGKVVTAILGSLFHTCAWLDTSESEIIATGVTAQDIVQIEDFSQERRKGGSMEWKKRKHITPLHAQNLQRNEP